MAFNQELTNRVRSALANMSHVTEKKMFRGITFMVNGKMCMSVGDNELLVRLDPAIYDQMVKKPGCRAMVMKGRVYKGYVFVNEDVIRTTKELSFWVGLALSFNRQAKASKKS